MQLEDPLPPATPPTPVQASEETGHSAKRGRGRPPKPRTKEPEPEVAAPVVKRPRGRPRKHPNGIPERSAPAVSVSKRPIGRPRKKSPVPEEVIVATKQPTFQISQQLASKISQFQAPAASSPAVPPVSAPPVNATPIRAPPPVDLGAPVPEFQRREYFCAALRDALRAAALNTTLNGFQFKGRFCELVNPGSSLDEFLMAVVADAKTNGGLLYGGVACQSSAV